MMVRVRKGCQLVRWQPRFLPYGVGDLSSLACTWKPRSAEEWRFPQFQAARGYLSLECATRVVFVVRERSGPHIGDIPCRFNTPQFPQAGHSKALGRKWKVQLEVLKCQK